MRSTAGAMPSMFTSPQTSWQALSNRPCLCCHVAHALPFRDGLITTTHTDTSALVATCKDLTGTVTPLHDLAATTAPPACVAASAAIARRSGAPVAGFADADSCVAAAAWLDKLLVFRAAWKGGAAPVVSIYQCPEVSWLAAGQQGSPGKLTLNVREHRVLGGEACV